MDGTCSSSNAHSRLGVEVPCGRFFFLNALAPSDIDFAIRSSWFEKKMQFRILVAGAEMSHFWTGECSGITAMIVRVRESAQNNDELGNVLHFWGKSWGLLLTSYRHLAPCLFSNVLRRTAATRSHSAASESAQNPPHRRLGIKAMTATLRSRFPISHDSSVTTPDYSSSSDSDDSANEQDAALPAFTPPQFTIKELLGAIPAHCFERSALRSSSYIVMDVLLIAGWMLFAGQIDSALGWNGSYLAGGAGETARWAAWSLYWFGAGLSMTGLWVIAHECQFPSLSSSSYFFRLSLFPPFERALIDNMTPQVDIKPSRPLKR